MTTYTADDFKAAGFAKHPSGGVACKPGDDRPWICHSLKSDREFFLVDESMAELGWAPVPAGSYTRTDDVGGPLDETVEFWQARWKEAADRADARDLAAHQWKKVARKLSRESRNAHDWAERVEASIGDVAARAETAEQALVEMTAHRDQCRDTAIKWQMEANRAVQPRALTPDDITDAMVERGAEKFRSLPTTMSAHARVSIILTAAFTPPPTRPEGAEAIERLLTEGLGDFSPPATPEAIADLLAVRGVRVTGAES